MTPAVGRRLGNVLLTVGALLGAACLALVALGPLLGLRPLLFRSDSMSPTIESGDLAISRTVAARDLAVGDIVSLPTRSGERVTHRVVDLRQYDGRALLTLRGDANEGVDPAPYEVSSVDRVVVVVPEAGHVLAALTAPVGLLLLGVVAAGLLALVVRGGPRNRAPRGPGDGPTRGSRGGSRKAEGPSGRHRLRRARRAARLGAAAGSAMVVLVGGSASAAPWTDDVAITGSGLTATTVSAPVLSCGALGVLSVTFDWTAVSGATGYQLTAGGTTYPVQATTTRTITAVITGGTATVVAHRNFGSTTWTSVASNQRTYTVAVVSLCS